MSFLKKKRVIPTYLKYLLSYLLICLVFIGGTYFIIRSQMTAKYFEQRVNSAKMQLDYVAQEMKESLVYLTQLDSALGDNDIIVKNRLLKENIDNKAVMKELGKYDVSSKIIRNIVYMSRNSGTALSSNLAVTWQDEGFCIVDSSGERITFEPSPWLGSISSQLIYLSNEKVQFLIYLPGTSLQYSQIYFYILDIDEMYSQMKSLVSEEVQAVVLVNREGEIITGVNDSLLIPYLDAQKLENGIYLQEDESSLCVSQEIRSGYHLVSLVSSDFLMQQIFKVFASSYRILLLLSLVGFLLIYMAMRVTYMPLRRLTQNVSKDSSLSASHLKQLEDSFSEINCRNQLLQDKLDNYRSSIQQSLLDSLMISKSAEAVTDTSRIDHFFNISLNKKIFIIYLYSPTGVLPEDAFRESLRPLIPEEDFCFGLEREENKGIFLINFTGEVSDKEGRIKEVLQCFFKDYGCFSAISIGSESPMDIPKLYENAMDASQSWPQIPVADGNFCSQNSFSYVYPHEKLQELSDSLSRNDFARAGIVTDELLKLLDESDPEERELQNYYVYSILIDLLMNIVSAMNWSNIEFSTYSNLYYEVLYFCRSCSYSEKSGEIAADIRELLSIYERINVEKLVNSAPLRQVMEERYCQPEFSIAELAEKFHVSVSQMSLQFKKEMNMNFSDYLWMMRLDKAKELLRTTDIPVEEISIAVGYYSRSSFMKKFKRETGLSPSQFRMSE